jgi:hypothetical protein
MLAERQGCPPRGGIRRKLEAKHWLDEQKSHEADVLDEEANIFKVQYLYGKHRRKCGGHKCESGRSYPGRPVFLSHVGLSRPEGGKKGTQESAEGIVKLQEGSHRTYPTGHGLWKTGNARGERIGPEEETGAAEGPNVRGEL